MRITKMKDSMIDEKKRCKRTYDLMRNKIARIPLFLFLSFFFDLKTVRVTHCCKYEEDYRVDR